MAVYNFVKSAGKKKQDKTINKAIPVVLCSAQLGAARKRSPWKTFLSSSALKSLSLAQPVPIEDIMISREGHIGQHTYLVLRFFNTSIIIVLNKNRFF